MNETPAPKNTARARILIINGDDFGASTEINDAIIRAHREGILTSASLMVNGEAFEQAVALAKDHPELGVGIHITLLRGHATLSNRSLPNLVDAKGHLPEDPVGSGLRCFFSRKLQAQVAQELEAQIRKFLATGLTPSHMDGHLHFHVHPAVVKPLVKLAEKYGIAAFRLPRESFMENVRLDRSSLPAKFLHAVIFRKLSIRAERHLRRRHIAFPDHFFGLLACGHMDEKYLLGVIERLKPGVTEIGMHPAVGIPSPMRPWAPHYLYREELQAILSPSVREALLERGIQLSSYKTLTSIQSQ